MQVRRSAVVFVPLMICSFLPLVGAIIRTDSITLGMISFLAMLLFYYLYLYLSGAKIFINVVYLVPLVAFIYICTYPIMHFWLGYFHKSFRHVSQQDIIISTLFSITFIEIYCISTIFMPVLDDSKISSLNILKNLRTTSNNIPMDIAFFVFFRVIYKTIKSIGGISYVLTGAISRRLITNAFYSIPVYAYLKYAFVGYSVYVIFSMFNYRNVRQNPLFLIFRVVLVVSFFSLNTLMGNRRELIYLLLAIVLYFLYKKHGNLTVKLAIPISVLFVWLAYYGYYRLHLSANMISLETKLLDSLGEFIYPLVTLYYYIGNRPSKFKMGITPLLFFWYFIPRKIYPNKPVQLAIQFTIDYGTSMGYAYTPMTELFVNFSYFGAIIGGVFYAIFFYIISRNKNRAPILYLVVYMQLINFFRGELSSYVLEILIMYAVMKFMTIINGIASKHNEPQIIKKDLLEV